MDICSSSDRSTRYFWNYKLWLQLSGLLSDTHTHTCMEDLPFEGKNLFCLKMEETLEKETTTKSTASFWGSWNLTRGWGPTLQPPTSATVIILSPVVSTTFSTRKGSLFNKWSRTMGSASYICLTTDYLYVFPVCKTSDVACFLRVQRQFNIYFPPFLSSLCRFFHSFLCSME